MAHVPQDAHALLLFAGRGQSCAGPAAGRGLREQGCCSHAEGRGWRARGGAGGLGGKQGGDGRCLPQAACLQPCISGRQLQQDKVGGQRKSAGACLVAAANRQPSGVCLACV